MNMIKAVSSVTFSPESQMRRVILLSQLDVKHVATVKQPVTLAEDILGNMLTVASYSLHRHDGGSDLRSNSWQVCKNVLLPRVRFGFEGCSHYLVCSVNTKPLCGNGMSRLCIGGKTKKVNRLLFHAPAVSSLNCHSLPHPSLKLNVFLYTTRKSQALSPAFV